MASMKRGVGYCENTDCEDYAKGVFLLNHGDTFYCPRCRQLGKVEKERGFYTGNSDIFKEVRVEYNFDPINGVYREIAIVRDESLWGRNNVYTLQSPLIKTEKRALKVAEAILANLNRYRGLLNGDDIPRTTEIILSFDDDFDEFQRKLQQLSQGVGGERPARRPAASDRPFSSSPSHTCSVVRGLALAGPGVVADRASRRSMRDGRPSTLARALVLAPRDRLRRGRRARRRAAGGTTGRASPAGGARRTSAGAASPGSGAPRRPARGRRRRAPDAAGSRCAGSRRRGAGSRPRGPVSSRTSRASAASSLSPGCGLPPGSSQPRRSPRTREQHAALAQDHRLHDPQRPAPPARAARSAPTRRCARRSEARPRRRRATPARA